MEAVGLAVNRLIRVAYGPFRLGDLKPGAVEEIKARVLRDQLGLGGGEDMTGTAKKKPVRKRTPGGPGGPGGSAKGGKPGARPRR
jgi:23S rRNA pseudouridine2605 synthase